MYDRAAYSMLVATVTPPAEGPTIQDTSTEVRLQRDQLDRPRGP